MSWYDEVLAGRNPFGTVGFSIGDALSPWMANNASALDPRLQNLGYSTNVSHQEGDVYSLNAPDGLDQQGYIMQDGNPMVQVSRQAAGLVKDPSQVRYDPRYGMVTSRENYNLQDSPIDRLVGGATRAIAVGAPFAFMGGLVPGVEGVFGPGATPDMFGPGGGLSPEEAVMGGHNAAGSAANAASSAAGAIDPYMAGAAGGAGSPAASGGIWANLASGNLGAAGQGLLSWAASNPLQAAGALYSASGLLGGGNDSSGAGNTSSGPPAGLLNASSFKRPTWAPNANTLAQLQQLYGGQYGG